MNRPLKNATNPILAAVLLAACGASLGCREKTEAPRPPATSNNLKFVRCKPAGTTEIVVNLNTGTEADDEVVFVCAGAAVVWKAADAGTLPFHILFTDSPFKSGKTTVDSSSGATSAEDTKPLPAKRRAVVYKYRLLFGPDVNHPTAEFDPHVIPM